jgi:UDP-N-acetylmuramate dehydrogenase
LSKHYISNTFGLISTCLDLIEVSKNSLLPEIIRSLSSTPVVIGEGSNVILNDVINRPVLKLLSKHVEVVENDQHFVIEADAGLNWNDFVFHLIEYYNIYGLENLAAIPGTVGAAPIQNIGAYGVEVSQFINSVTGFNLDSNEFQVMSNTECDFGYRTSTFKTDLHEKFIITSVTFKLSKLWVPKLAYSNLKDYISNHSTPRQIFEKISELRWSKLPRPAELGNSGSFFKNPIVRSEIATRLSSKYPRLPVFNHSSTSKKIPAAWLIEFLGFKGKRFNSVGMYKKQALVMVNYSNAKFSDVVNLKENIVTAVFQEFGIHLEAEPRFIV